MIKTNLTRQNDIKNQNLRRKNKLPLLKNTSTELHWVTEMNLQN
jgi:hypothetical protein